MKTNDEKVLSDSFKRHRSELIYKIPDGLEERILEDLMPPPKPAMPFVNWMFFGGGALAVCIGLVLSFQFGKMSAGGNASQVLAEEIVSSHVRSLMVAHLSDVISNEQHTVKPWFEGKIDFAPMVKDFPDKGYTLTGGRLDYIGGHATAALVYRFKLHVINMLQQPSTNSEYVAPHLRTLRGFQVYAWSKDGMNFWVVSDINTTDLHSFVELWL